MRSIAELEKRIHCLEKENQYLKKLLADAGISYSEKEIDVDVNEYDPNQGARIIPRNITERDAKVFFSMFWGRTDVYSKRTIKKSTGEVNLVEDYCEHYCIIDRQVVWYGSMNFLGKEDAEDNLMRIADQKIANELLELTFGNENYHGETL